MLYQEMAGTWAPMDAWPGCFIKRGMITIESEEIDEDELLEIALEAGAEDMKNDDGAFGHYD